MRPINRRSFLRFAPPWAAASKSLADVLANEPAGKAPIIDTHMHVWSGDLDRYPLAHPYDARFKPPPIAATVELLLQEMEQFGMSHCVLVQTISHGWDNRYLVQCVKRDPKRFRGHGLIDPTDPKVAEKLEFWIRQHGLAGMRFSPIYYEGKDDWLNARSSRALWEKADELGAVFNFFIATPQLPKLEGMVRDFPRVPVVIDHLARIDLKAADPTPEFAKLLALARYPNVWTKVSELSVISASGKYPYADTFRWVQRLYESFGPDRLLWGTGFPGATRGQAGRPSLTNELNLVREEIPFFTAQDREKILGRNAAKLWRFENA
ncbi:MAG: amidohydrolase [Verrucomicrobia bacterium]|nr:amidohydrolase [Verrucomicrobiota bacterium]